METSKQSPKFLTFLLPSITNIFWIVPFYAVLTQGIRMMSGDGDLGRHLTLGRYILANQQIPKFDIFSHTMTGQPLTPHEWLSQVLFALAERIFGFEGVILLSAFVIATAFWLVFKRTRQASQAITPTIASTTLVIITSMMHWLTRPHIFTFLLLALWMMMLGQLHQGKMKHWWMLPVLMLFWANQHGAFIAGFVTWLIYGVGVAWDAFIQPNPENEALPENFWRHYLLGGGVSFLATLINPSGIGLWKTSVGYVGTQYLVNETIEYQTPNFHEIKFWPFLIFIGILILVLGLNHKKIKAHYLFPAAAWLLMSLYSARNIPLFAIVAAPLLAQALDTLMTQPNWKGKWIKRIKAMDRRFMTVDSQLNGGFWPVLIVIIAIAGMASGMRFDLSGQPYGYDPEKFPVEAVDWLKGNPQEGEMFNYFMWGGYLLHRLWPDERVFIDGQTDFYGEKLTRQYGQVIQVEEGWQEVFEQFGIDWAILPKGTLSARAIQSKLNWEVFYQDDIAVILRKP